MNLTKRKNIFIQIIKKADLEKIEEENFSSFEDDLESEDYEILDSISESDINEIMSNASEVIDSGELEEIEDIFRSFEDDSSVRGIFIRQAFIQNLFNNPENKQTLSSLIERGFLEGMSEQELSGIINLDDVSNNLEEDLRQEVELKISEKQNFNPQTNNIKPEQATEYATKDSKLKTPKSDRFIQKWNPWNWLEKSNELLKKAESGRINFNFNILKIPGTNSNDFLKAARERFNACFYETLSGDGPDELLYNMLGIIFVLGQENQSLFGGLSYWQEYNKLSIGMGNPNADFEKFLLGLNLSEDQKNIFRFVLRMAKKHRLGLENPSRMEVSDFMDPGIKSNILPSPDAWKPHSEKDSQPYTPFPSYNTSIDRSSFLSDLKSKGKYETVSALEIELNSMPIESQEEQELLHKIQGIMPELDKLSDLEARERIFHLFK